MLNDLFTGITTHIIKAVLLKMWNIWLSLKVYMFRWYWLVGQAKNSQAP